VHVDSGKTSTRKRPKRPWTISRIGGGIRRHGPAAVADWAAVAAAYVVAIAVRTGGRPEVLDPEVAPLAIGLAFAAGGFQVVSNLVFAVYWRDWSAAAIEDMVALIEASGAVAALLLLFNLGTDTHWIPTGAVIAGATLSLLMEATLHLRPRWPQLVRAAFGRSAGAENLIVVGAGRLAQLLAADVARGSGEYRISCFVDDDPRKTGSYVRGIRVSGQTADLPELIERFHATTIVIAIANVPGDLVRRVMDACEKQDVRVRRVNGFSLLRRDTSALQPIGIEELLSREPVDLTDRASTIQHYRNKRILITGGAGSIGSELARQVSGLAPERLFLLDTNESGLHAVRESIVEGRPVEIILGDIRDRRWLRHTFETIRPAVVFHAAAYKHVPILERTPLPGISANVLGTANVLLAASSSGVERFVFISTDKAVEPSSVLGVTKRFGEILTLAYALKLSRSYAVVRFGNVLGTAGSAVPIFARQIDEGGPVTVTHPEATRYFMTIQEAVGLLIEAGALAQSGDILVLDMGKPMSIADLAERMIRLRGLRTPTDIEIRYIGLRPGEKLHEQLFSADERAVGTSNARVLRAEGQEQLASVESLMTAVGRIAELVDDQDADGALELVGAVIGGTRVVQATRAIAE